MSNATTKSIDGKYILYPDGGSWEYAEIRGGRHVGYAEESNVATHAGAGDRLAWLADLDHENIPAVNDPDACRRILDAADHADADVESYIIGKIA